MLRMDQVHIVRHKVLVEKLSVRRVAREMGISRNTVKKYLAQSEPRRKEGKPRSSAETEKVRQAIDELLEGKKGETTKKQRWTSPRMVEVLKEEGIPTNERTVRRIMAEIKKKKAEVYVPLAYHPGEMAEVDFFEVMVKTGGERTKAFLFVMREMFSGGDYARLYFRQDQVSFLDGCVKGFEYLGGVPQRVVFDNLKPAVQKVLVGAGREKTRRFAALESHYLFEACFTRPGEGHDKGGVEARGRGIRWQHFTPIPEGESLEEINQYLLKRLEEKAADRKGKEGRPTMECLQESRRNFMPLPQFRFESSKEEPTIASPRALVKIDRAEYSVPEEWARREITGRVGVDFVELCYQGKTVQHPRKRPGEKSIIYTHYLGELSRKPQALRQVMPELLEELGSPFTRVWRDVVELHGPGDAARHFSYVLKEIKEQGIGAIGKKMEDALSRGENPLLSIREEAPHREVPVPQAFAGIQVVSSSVMVYDTLLGVH